MVLLRDERGRFAAPPPPALPQQPGIPKDQLNHDVPAHHQQQLPAHIVHQGPIPPAADIADPIQPEAIQPPANIIDGVPEQPGPPPVNVAAPVHLEPALPPGNVAAIAQLHQALQGLLAL